MTLGIGGFDQILPAQNALPEPMIRTARHSSFSCAQPEQLEIQSHLPNKVAELIGSVEPDISTLPLFFLNE